MYYETAVIRINAAGYEDHARPASSDPVVRLRSIVSAPLLVDAMQGSSDSASQLRPLSQAMDHARPPSGIRAARTYRSQPQDSSVRGATRLWSPPDSYLVTLVLAPTELTLANGCRRLLDGPVLPGTACVTGPGRQLVIAPRGSCNLVHLAVPQHLVDLPRSALAKFGCMVVRDPLFATIGQLLADAPASWLQANADMLSQIALVRLLHLAPRHSSGCLTMWRLKRIHAYVDAHIDEPLRLADLAAVVGLSRMHFAAQFRAATGMAPHAFVVARRIDRAKALMATTDSALVNVALDAGFQSQAHFCAVFKQQTGMTPSRWRCCETRWPHTPKIAARQ